MADQPPPMITNERSTEWTITPNLWANRSLGDDPHVALETFQKGLTVNLIATDRSDALLFTQFADKVAIIRKHSRLAMGRNNFENEFKQVRSLRDHLAHANDYAASSEAASKVCGTVRIIEKWNEEFSKWLRAMCTPVDTPRPSTG